MVEGIEYALIGGVLIGLSASWLLLAQGRICGISGIVGGLMKRSKVDFGWKLMFVAGLLTGGAVLMFTSPEVFQNPEGRPLAVVAFSGLLVGYGTQLGSGCTSGHGICGLTRLSPRSLVATLTFMLSGIIAATLYAVTVGGG